MFVTYKMKILKVDFSGRMITDEWSVTRRYLEFDHLNTYLHARCNSPALKELEDT
jgi:hypothetical protein